MCVLYVQTVIGFISQVSVTLGLKAHLLTYTLIQAYT